MNSFKIVFDKESFFTGDYVTGQLVIQNHTPVIFKEIILAFKGHARFSMTRPTSVNSKFKNIRHFLDKKQVAQSKARSHEDALMLSEFIFSEEIRLFRSAELRTLSPGEHTFKISYKLPTQIPSSYEGALGKIQYMATAIVDKAVAQSDITVIKALDFHQSLLSLKQMSKIKSLNRLPVVSNKRSVFVELSSTGVVSPGAKLRTILNVLNSSAIRISNVTLKLTRTEHYQIRECGEEVVKIGLHSVDLGSVEAGAEKSFTEFLEVPDDHDPNLAHCSIITVNHSVKAVVKPSGMFFKFSVKLPVVVGTLNLCI